MTSGWSLCREKNQSKHYIGVEAEKIKSVLLR